MPLQSEINALRRLTHELLHLGSDGAPIYADRFRELNTEVYRQCEHLFVSHGSTAEEEASLCIALLMGYSATIYNHGDKEERMQEVLDRSWEVLDKLPASVLKCELLIHCYEEIGDGELLKEASAIVDSWAKRELTESEQVIVKLIKSDLLPMI